MRNLILSLMLLCGFGFQSKSEEISFKVFGDSPQTVKCKECGENCKCIECLCESRKTQNSAESRLDRLENSVARLVILMEGGQKPASITPAVNGDYQWEAIPHPGAVALSGWREGDHFLKSGNKNIGWLRGNGWYFNIKENGGTGTMAEPPIARPTGIRTPVIGEKNIESDGSIGQWLPGNMYAAIKPGTQVQQATKSEGTPNYYAPIFDERTGKTLQVPVYYYNDDGSQNMTIRQGCDRPLRPNPVEFSVPAGKSPTTVSQAVPLTSHFASAVSMDHTHTCPKCSYTWNHSEDGGSHHCPKCGTFQNVQSSSRASQPTTFRPVTGMVSGGCSNGQCGSSFGSYPVGQAIWSSSGGCVNGNCSQTRRR